MKNLTTKTLPILFILIASLLSSGCTFLAVGGTAAAVISDQRSAGEMIDDENIEVKMTYKFFSKKALAKSSHLNVTSYNGWLLLTGETPSQEEKDMIYNMAIDIRNVKRVFNKMQISAPSSYSTRVSDTYLTAKIKTQLLSSDTTSALRTKVISENGIIYLLGLITQEQSEMVVDVIKKIHGVQKIVKLFDYQ